MYKKEKINWNEFRKINFSIVDEELNSKGINLNPGTMGTPSKKVLEAIESALHNSDNPLKVYSDGRNKLIEIRKKIKTLFPLDDFEVAVGGSTTYWCHSIAYSLISLLSKNNCKTIKLLTSKHEHHGAIRSFTNNPMFEVFCINDSSINNEEEFAAYIKKIKPDICLFSQITWDKFGRIPVNKLFSLSKMYFPKIVNILDCAQTVGLYPIEKCNADLIVSSAHKWLFGPQGTGFMWIKKSFLDSLPPFHHGEVIDASNPASQFEDSGGYTYFLYHGLLEALSLFEKVDQERVLSKSIKLAEYLNELIQNMKFNEKFKVEVKGPVLNLNWLDIKSNLPYEVYKSLNEKNISIKYIKIFDQKLNSYRIGVPYFESKERLNKAVSTLESLLFKLA